MVHVRFDPNSNDFQIGYGIEGVSSGYFKGLPPYQRGYGYQRGAGLGDILRGVWRFLLPVLKTPAVKELSQAMGKEAITSGSKILTKAIEGEPIKAAAIEEGKNIAESLLEKSLERVKKSRQTGSGLPIKRKRKSVGVISTTYIPPKSLINKKRKRSDAFGFY